MLDKPKKPQFFAIKVNVNKKLFKKFIMGETFLSHVTLLYKPTKDDIDMMAYSVGSQVILKSKYVLLKPNVGATLVFEPINIYFEMSEPHLTISTNGQRPAVSNDIIKEYNSSNETDIKCIPFEMEQEGIVCGAVYGKGGLTFVSDAKWLKT